jgi:hypothetical protein
MGQEAKAGKETNGIMENPSMGLKKKKKKKRSREFNLPSAQSIP